MAVNGYRNKANMINDGGERGNSTTFITLLVNLAK